MAPRSLSKTRYLQGLQCPKLLWTSVHRPDELPETDEATRARFDEGHLVGDLAKALFPGGIELPWGGGVAAACRETREALAARKPLFEATLGTRAAGGSLHARVDVLSPVGKGAWDLIEVKSTTGVKDVHLPDVAFQRHVAEASGVKIRRCAVLHLSSEYRHAGEIDPEQLFCRTSVTGEVRPHHAEVEENAARLFRTLRRAKAPEVEVGPHCDAPYGCPLKEGCWEFLPDRHVFRLWRGGAKAWELFGQGVTVLRDIPRTYALSDKQRRQLRCEKTGKPHVDRGAVREFLGGLRYPLHYLDFETFSTAVPLFDGVGPWRQVPFQFSLHVQQELGGALEHHGFLADHAGRRSDPRPEFLRRLRKVLGRKGSIVAYHASFEQDRLRECADAFPEFAGWVGDDVARRFVDLLVPFRSMDVYHPAQDGSASLKAVLPALTGRGYDDLEIADGQAAGREFLRVGLGGVTRVEQRRVCRHLEQYCSRDTEAMVWLVAALRQLTRRRAIHDSSSASQ
ncbi:MAG: DUF2779 domain-containing protein [Coriobacteriia bacterium]